MASQQGVATMLMVLLQQVSHKADGIAANRSATMLMVSQQQVSHNAEGVVKTG